MSLSKFHKMYKKNGDMCWEWKGVLCSGYGWYQCGDTKDYAHRIMYTLATGEEPQKSCVRHSCDNRKCVNPAHLLLGTKKQNSQDMVDRDRSCRGERRRNAKLTDVKVSLMRKLYETGGVTCQQLGEKFGVSKDVAARVIRRVAWKHVKE